MDQMDYYSAASFDIAIGLLLICQFDGVTDLYGPIESRRSFQCHSRKGICPQCYVNNIVHRVDDLKEDIQKLVNHLNGGRYQYSATTTSQSASIPSAIRCEETQSDIKGCAKKAVHFKGVHCKKNGICPQCCLEQISTTEVELSLLRQTIVQSELQQSSSKTILEINTLQKRLTSLQEEVKRFKIILLEALNQLELRNDCWIPRKTITATKSTVEFIRNLFCIPRILHNAGEIDGLN